MPKKLNEGSKGETGRERQRDRETGVRGHSPGAPAHAAPVSAASDSRWRAPGHCEEK